MPELQDSMLGTSPEHKISYAVQQTGSRLIGDLFLASYLANCLHLVDGIGPMHKLMLASAGHKCGATPEKIKTQLDQADDNLRWAAQMKAENYHRTNVLAFLSLWAAHETGHENIIAAILNTIQPAAASATNYFKLGKYNITDWPWSEDVCLEIAQKLDQKAKEKTKDGGRDCAARLITLYGWLGVSLSISASSSQKFNEASMVRNVLLHRYGRLGPRDIDQAPHLAESQNKAIHLTQTRLDEYYQSVIDIHLAVTTALTEKGWH